GVGGGEGEDVVADDGADRADHLGAERHRVQARRAGPLHAVERRLLGRAAQRHGHPQKVGVLRPLPAPYPARGSAAAMGTRSPDRRKIMSTARMRTVLLAALATAAAATPG